MKKQLFCVLCVFSLLLCAACGAPTVGDVGPSQSFFAMDTMMTITLMDGTEDDLTAAVQEVNALDAMLSRFQDGSPLAEVNAAAGSGVLGPVPQEVGEVLTEALSAARRSGGAFDPTIAPVADLWGLSGDTPTVPKDSDLQAVLPLVGYENVLLSDGGMLLSEQGMALDLGGVAKGYAAGKTAEVLKSRGVSSALLNIGGTVTAMGAKRDGSPWAVAVRDPLDEDGYLGLLTLGDGQTVSTSGGYERYFEENGTRYHHILDPKTGYPAEKGLLSATVVSENAALTDAFSTALFVLGEENALALWRESDDFSFILATEDGRVLVTEDLADSFTFWGEQHAYTLETVRR